MKKMELLLMKCIKERNTIHQGHGKLKDMDDIYEAVEGWNDDTGWIVDVIDCQAPTIIEADETENKEHDHMTVDELAELFTESEEQDEDSD